MWGGRDRPQDHEPSARGSREPVYAKVWSSQVPGEASILMARLARVPARGLEPGEAVRLSADPRARSGRGVQRTSRVPSRQASRTSTAVASSQARAITTAPTSMLKSRIAALRLARSDPFSLSAIAATIRLTPAPNSAFNPAAARPMSWPSAATGQPSPG